MVVIVSVGSLVVTIQAKVSLSSISMLPFTDLFTPSYLEAECTYECESCSVRVDFDYFQVRSSRVYAFLGIA